VTEKENNDLKTDPICLMEVKETEAVTTECNGVHYFFCSEGCRNKFLQDRTCARTAYDLIIVGGGPAGLTAFEAFKYNLCTGKGNKASLPRLSLNLGPGRSLSLSCPDSQ
jgi:YHS domain-containing protein